MAYYTTACTALRRSLPFPRSCSAYCAVVCFFLMEVVVGRTQFDWRWLVLVLVVLLFFGQVSLSLSPLFAIVLLGLCAWWMFQAGIRPWRGMRTFGSRHETYWRGQRVRLEQPRRSRFALPATLPLVSSICYFVMATFLAVAVIEAVVRLVQR